MNPKPKRQKAPELPAIPLSVRYVLKSSPNGCHHADVIVKFSVPSRVAAHLDEQGGVSIICCAGIGQMKLMAQRVRRWNHPFKTSPPHRQNLEAAAAEGCDTRIRVVLSPDEWHLVGHLCGRLRITPGQWFVGCATYNANLAESIMEKSLTMSVP